jgi:hypothetical protein
MALIQQSNRQLNCGPQGGTPGFFDWKRVGLRSSLNTRCQRPARKNPRRRSVAPPTTQSVGIELRRLFVHLERGLFESTRVSVSVSGRRKFGFHPSVSASKNSVPDSEVRDRFDDWVGGCQFGPFQLHHPVLSNQPESKWAVCAGIFAGIVLLFRSPATVAVSQAIFSLPSPHPKIPFPALGLRPPRPSGNSGILGAFWAKRTFRARSVPIVGQPEGFELLLSSCSSRPLQIPI